MKARNLASSLLTLAVLVLAGCGGGGGGAASSGGGATSATASGVASKGPIRNGHFQAFQIFSSSNAAKSRLSDTPFFSGLTDDKGNYSIPIPAGMSRDGLLVKVLDGTYLDEATQLDKSVAAEYPGGMRAAFGNISGAVRRGDDLKVYVTAFTEMAVRAAGAKLDDNSVRDANHQIEHAFGLDDKGIDIIHTRPLDPSAAPPAGSDDQQKAYTAALGIISQYEKDNSASGKNLTNLSDDLVAEVRSNGGALSAATSSKMSSSELNYDNSGNNKTGVLPAAAPSIALATDKSTTLNDGASALTITATVTQSGAPVAGAEVKFTIKSGQGKLSEKSVLTDASGKAAVALTSLIDGDLDVVTASAGGISADSATLSFVNPARPGAVTLSASPSSGTTLANGAVTLSATVSPASPSATTANGTAVTFTITSGTGTLSAVTTTSGGVATASLSAASANTITVTAKAGTVTSSPVTVKFIDQPTKAILKISTTGVPAGTLIGGLNLILTLPVGVTVQKNADNSTAAGVVAASGVAAASGSLAAANAATAGSLNIGMISSNGFGGGEFVTINADIAAGSFPQPGDFSAALNGSVISTTVATIPNVALSLAATIQ